MKPSHAFLIWALFSLLTFLISGYLTARAARCLKSDSVPGGIIAFEVAWTDSAAARILADWSERGCGEGTAIHAALDSIKVDYYFIPSYCLFLSFLLALLTPGDSVSRSWLATVWVSGLLDLMENLLMSQALISYPVFSVSAWTYSFPSSLKWAVLAVVTFRLMYSLYKKFFTWVKNIG